MLKQAIKRYLPTYLKIRLKDSSLNSFRVLIRNIQFRYSAPKVYGQSAEDFLLRQWLPENRGSYIDVGAGEPIRGSNTYWLYKRGWSGVLVEPISENCRILKLLRSRDKILQVLVGDVAGFTDFYEFEPYQYSTTVPSVAQGLQKRSIRLKKIHTMRVCLLSELAPEMNPLSPTLISIDVEGADLSVLKSNNWHKTRPRVICVEELDVSNNESQLSAYLTIQGYQRVTYTTFSSIWVENSYIDYLKLIAGQVILN